MFIAGFTPAEGASAATISGKFPGSSLAETARLMAATQRPITEAALSEAAEGPQVWTDTRSYFLIAGADKNIPPAAGHFMAERAKGEVVSIAGASHAVFASHPDEVADLVLRAAKP